MRKIFALLSAVVLSMALMVGCSSSSNDDVIDADFNENK